MTDEVRAVASQLKADFGVDALKESRRRLDAATDARDHRAGVLWAEVCLALSKDRD